jgi:hypothetical protein
MTTKQETQEQNGTPQTLDLATAQQVIQAAEQQADERFFVEYKRLCEYHKRRIQMVPNGLNNDNSIRWVEAIKRLV